MLKDAIAVAQDPTEKQVKVEALREAIGRGQAEAEGLDATNPERQRMNDAWCTSADPARTGDPKTAIICAKVKAKRDFFARREALIQFWCVDKSHSGSRKCLQMEFGHKMQQTDSGEERKRLAGEFNADRSAEATAALEQETKEMMHAACASPVGKQELFSNTCAKLHTEL